MDGFRFRKLESEGDDKKTSASRDADAGYGSNLDDVRVVVRDSHDVNSETTVGHLPLPCPGQSGTYLSACKCRFIGCILFLKKLIDPDLNRFVRRDRCIPMKNDARRCQHLLLPTDQRSRSAMPPYG